MKRTVVFFMATVLLLSLLQGSQAILIEPKITITLSSDSIRVSDEISATWEMENIGPNSTLSAEWLIYDQNGAVNRIKASGYLYGGRDTITINTGASGKFVFSVTTGLGFVHHFESKTFTVENAPNHLRLAGGADMTEMEVGQEVQISWEFTGGHPPYIIEYMMGMMLEPLPVPTRDIVGESTLGKDSVRYRPWRAGVAQFSYTARDSIGDGDDPKEFHHVFVKVTDNNPIKFSAGLVADDIHPDAPAIFNWSFTGGTAPFTPIVFWYIYDKDGQVTSITHYPTGQEDRLIPREGVGGEAVLQIRDDDGRVVQSEAYPFTITGTSAYGPL